MLLRLGGLLCLLGAISPLVRSEMFTALVHMEGLVKLEGELSSELRGYIRREKDRLRELERFLEGVESAQSLPRGEPKEHLYHPTNALSLVQRYHRDWDQRVGELVYQDNSHELMSAISFNKHQFPSYEDYKGAVTAIVRLQDTYQLPAHNLTQPEMAGVRAVAMTARDCFDVGHEAYNQEQWWYVREWMLEALQKVEEEQSMEEIELASIYDHIAYAEYKLGNVKKAMQYTRDLLQNEPDHERAQRNLDYFSKELAEDDGKFDTAVTEHLRDVGAETLHYEKLCREADLLPPRQHHKLVCFYFTNRHKPRLLLRPAKVEVVYPRPKIFVFRDLLSESEMARLRELAQPLLNRATISSVDGTLIHADYRISKSGWLGEDKDPLGHVTRINNRLEDITGLTMSTAEELQVVNYGIGGHYEPHFDFARKDEDAFSSLGHGNRIATVLIYMSNVTLGGATVFTELGARIAPTNGDATFWWNLKQSGEGDMTTRHAGCPVLVGTKWVCNKWIHEVGQEFRRPCGLSPEQ